MLIEGLEKLPSQTGKTGYHLMSDGQFTKWDYVQNTPIRAGFHIDKIYPNHITNNNDGTVTVLSAECDFYDDTLEEIRHYIISETIVTLTPNASNMIYADRDTLSFGATTNMEFVNDIRYVRLAEVYLVQNGGYYIHSQISPVFGYGGAEARGHRQFHTNRYARESGFDQMAVDTNLNITGNGGVMWAGDTLYDITSIGPNTVNHTFTHDASGNWQVYVVTGPKINNTQFDPVTGVTTLTQNKMWTINYIYRGIENEDHLYITLSPNEYESYVLAKGASEIHIPPDLISSHAVLIGRVMVQLNGTATPQLYTEVTATTPIYGSATPVNNHNDLALLDGGIIGEYYHLPQLNYNEVIERNFPTLVIGTSADNTTFETDGTLVMEGSATVWDDLTPSSVTVGGGASSPSFTSYNGNLKAYQFPGIAGSKDLILGFQISHKYLLASNVVPHLHLHIPDDVTGGVILFQCEYEWVNIGENGTTGTTTVSGSITRTASQGISNNTVLSFGSISGSGRGISSMFTCRIYRDPTVPGDNFGSSVWLKSADLHFESDTLGSRGEFIK